MVAINSTGDSGRHTNPLVTKLLETIHERGLSIPKFATETGIPRDRIYKWIQEGTNPKADDARVIEKWIDGENSDYREKYIKLLEETNQGLKTDLGSLTKRIGAVESILGLSSPGVVHAEANRRSKKVQKNPPVKKSGKRH